MDQQTEIQTDRQNSQIQCICGAFLGLLRLSRVHSKLGIISNNIIHSIYLAYKYYEHIRIIK